MRAFSLVELSIVLVILGLLTGGVLSGQSLIRAAELRSLTTQTQQYLAAIHSFRDRYLAKPGDIRNATSFWGAADPDETICRTTVGTGTQTCNGDGDGRMSGPTATATQGWEGMRAWQHLANAGLIEGTYTGVFDPAYIFGGNVPTAKLSNTGFSFKFLGTGGTTEHFPESGGNLFEIGRTNATNSTTLSGVILRPEELWSLDSKIDDGKPGMGKVQSRRGSSVQNPNCSIGDDGPTAEYNLSSSNILCSYLVKID